MIRFNVTQRPVKMDVQNVSQSPVEMNVQNAAVVYVGGDNGKKPRIGWVTLSASEWVGKDQLWSQIVSIDGVTPLTQVDLTPSVEQLRIFYDKSLAFVAENEDGTVTVYAIGQRPTHDYTIQITMTEVIV